MSSMFDDDVKPDWAESALSTIDPIKASKYREQLPSLDRKLQGLSDKVKAEVLRVMINTDIKPEDSANILAILYGHIQAIAETIPQEMREASSEFRVLLTDFVQETQIFPEVVAQVHKRVADDVTEQALQMGKAGVAAAATEEIERMRIRLTSTAEEMLKQFLDNAIKEKLAHSSDVLVLKHRSITVVATVIILCVGFLSGGVFGQYHPHFTNDQNKQMRYGEEFIRMYPQMPESIAAWVKNWVGSHPSR